MLRPLPVTMRNGDRIAGGEQGAVEDLLGKTVGGLILDASVESVDYFRKRIEAQEVAYRLVQVEDDRPDHRCNGGQARSAIDHRSGHCHRTEPEKAIHPGCPEESLRPPRHLEVAPPVGYCVQCEVRSHPGRECGCGMIRQDLSDEDAGEDMVGDEHRPTLTGTG
jgi:hypothetical protein